MCIQAEKFCYGEGLETDVRKTYSSFEDDPLLSITEKSLFKVRHEVSILWYLGCGVERSIYYQ